MLSVETESSTELIPGFITQYCLVNCDYVIEVCEDAVSVHFLLCFPRQMGLFSNQGRNMYYLA